MQSVEFGALLHALAHRRCQRTPRQDIPPAAPQTLRAEGWRGLYSGFLPTWARLGPWQLTFWVSYEQLRKWGGLASF